jgi:hypothetical protein
MHIRSDKTVRGLSRHRPDRLRRPSFSQYARAAAFGLIMALYPAHGLAQATPGSLSSQTVIGGNVKQHADAVLAVMTYTTVPDVTTSSLSINSGTTGNPSFGQSQLGGGFTLSRSFPLYVEGTIAYSRYDPTFVATDGAEQRAVPTKWNTFSGTIGIGWDFRITDELAFRPILNGTLGRVSSDLKVGQSIFNRVTDSNLQFLQNGYLDAYGYGGSLMLDYEHYRENYEIDAELRATDIYLRSFGGSSEAVQGSAMAQQVSLWTRGVGLELDSSRYPIIITRTRAMVRYMFGHNVHGVSFGFAMSF